VGIIVTTLQEECGGLGSGIVQVMIEVDIVTLGQFTGLHDKNGVEIFEGDIVEGAVSWQDDIKNHVVRFTEDEYGYQPFVEYHETCEGRSRKGSYMYKVIGNIYSNPELLKEGE